MQLLPTPFAPVIVAPVPMLRASVNSVNSIPCPFSSLCSHHRPAVLNNGGGAITVLHSPKAQVLWPNWSIAVTPTLLTW